MEGWVQLKCCSLPFLTVESLSEYTLFVNYWLFCKVSLKRNAAKMQSEKAFEKAFDLEDPVLNINIQLSFLGTMKALLIFKAFLYLL